MVCGKDEVDVATNSLVDDGPESQPDPPPPAETEGSKELPLIDPGPEPRSNSAELPQQGFPEGTRSAATLATQQSGHDCAGDCIMPEYLTDANGTSACVDRNVPPTPLSDSGVAATEPKDQNGCQKRHSHLPDLELPDWFIQHCVTSSNEWGDVPDTLILRDTKVPAHDKELSVDMKTSTDQQDTSLYEMSPILFEPLRGLLSSRSSPNDRAKDGAANTPEIRFRTDTIELKVCVDKCLEAKEMFLDGVVKRFARIINADLITLTRDDLEDLADHFRRQKAMEDRKYAEYMDFLLLDDLGPCNRSVHQPDRRYLYSDESAGHEAAEEKLGLLQHRQTQAKRSAICSDVVDFQVKGPLVIHIIIEKDYKHEVIMNDLRKVIEDQNEILLIVSTGLPERYFRPPPGPPPRVVYSAHPPSPPPPAFPPHTQDGVSCIVLAPTRSKSQEWLMRKDGELRIQARNIRALQRAIRRKTPEDLTIDLLTPHAKWTFFQEVLSDDSNAARYLARASIEHADLEGVVQMVGDNFNAGHIKQAVLSIGTRREALQAWESFYDRSSETSDSLSSADDDDVTTSAWSNFPPKLQKVIRRIKSESGPDDKFYWEQSFLPNLVDPKEAKEGWAEIAIDPQTRKEIREAVAHHQNAARGSSLYGVLSRGHTGGALLYGPPGTGKTQLARVLACESGSVVICASPVDIEHKWAGDMPKSIKGLFNLGRLLSPSIIFIDEADSLFESRGEASPDWRRTIVNQLLSEMDGMSKSKANPFVLLSTNLPGNLDPAVLRRVPTRLYIGLPSTALRLKIFEIVLRDEILHPDVDFEILAFLTPRFSGSDIRSLCVKAAISCDTFVEVGENKGKRLLTRSLFEEAIARTSPSITKPALAAIRGFAKQSDTANLEKIQNMEIEESVIQRDLAPQKLRQTNLGEVQDCDSAGSELLVKTSPARPPDPSSVPSSPPLISASSRTGIAHRRQASAEKAGDEVNTESEDPGFVGLTLPTLYKPLEEGSKKIRVLSIEPASEDQSFPLPISCTLEEVDLEDWTPAYQSFCDGLPNMDDKNFRLIKGRVRHVVWDMHNRALQEGWDVKTPITPDDVKEIISLDGYCDRPLEDLKGLCDRYNWGDYLALSYVWGDQTHKKDVILNGSRFEVGPNLHDALSHLRNSFEVRSRKLKVWIDAICINQEDLGERATEVKKMDMIHSEALAVRGWLGYPSDEVSPEMPVVRSMLDHAFGLVNESEHHLNIPDIVHETRRVDFEVAQRLLDLVSVGEDNAYSLWIFVEEVFKHPYWKRLWIVQEVALASSLLFWYGDYALSTTELRTMGSKRLWSLGGTFRTLKRFIGEDRLFDGVQNSGSAQGRILSLRWDQGYGVHKGKKPIMELLTQARLSDATDLRDKVYGILELLPSTISSRVRPNYDLGFSWRDCWAMFAKSCFQGEGNLNLLARSAGHLTTNVEIPTWSFNLSYPRSLFFVATSGKDQRSSLQGGLDSEDSGFVPHHAINSFESSLGLEGKPHFSDDNRLLFCEGAFVDTVDAITAFRAGGQMKAAPAQHAETSPWESPRRPLVASSILSLARVLQQDSKLQSFDDPSLLDVPWFNADQLSHVAVKPDDLVLDQNTRAEVDDFGVWDFKLIEDSSAGKRVRWEEGLQDHILRELFSRVLHVNETFELHGVPLRDYFTCQDEYCKDWKEFKHAAEITTSILFLRRLFRTQNGLIGTVTKHAVPGDRIAIIYNCDMPVVLRPRGNKYEVVGGCFVDGLMNGEAVKDIQSGKLATESLCLC